jgi:hypothetical protein
MELRTSNGDGVCKVRIAVWGRIALRSAAFTLRNKPDPASEPKFTIADVSEAVKSTAHGFGDVIEMRMKVRHASQHSEQYRAENALRITANCFSPWRCRRPPSMTHYA